MLLGIGIFVVAIIALVLCCYRKCPPNKAYIISGPFKQRVLIGKGGLIIPFLERIDKINLGVMKIDVKTKASIPTQDFINVNVDATANIEISKEPEFLKIAAQNYLNSPKEKIAEEVNELLEGNLREIIGTMTLTSIVTDKKIFSAQVKENADPDLQKLGLNLINFNVQNVKDDAGVIDNLGIDNIVQIQKQAAIARAESERDIAIQKAKAAKEANDAQVEAKEQMAERNAQYETRQAALKKNVDTQKAQADAASEIEAENQRKLKEVAETDANIAKAEREAELKKKVIELREYELDALVRKQADADKYAAEKEAEATLVQRQKDAEARAYEIKQQAEAMRIEAEAKKYAAEQEAEGIAAIGKAEAEAIEKKAEAQKKFGEASVLEMYFKALPQIVANAAAPLTNVDKITLYGEGNSAKMVGDVMKTADQVMSAVQESTGLDLSSLIGGFLGGKAGNNE